MVQLKYFGDDRDFFKYDLLTHVLSSTDLINYAFIPMLTRHRQSNEGNKAPNHNTARSEELFRFIDLCPNKSLKHWEAWLNDHVESYKTIEPVDETFFSDENRALYWKKFLPVASTEKALVFVDPDTGMETGGESYLRKAGRDKYLLNAELGKLLGVLPGSSCLVIYQHLQRNKKRHELDVEKKLNQVRTVDAEIYIAAYREDDLVFIFVAKNSKVYEKIFAALTKYHEKVAHQYGAIYKSLPGSQKIEAERETIRNGVEIATSNIDESDDSGAIIGDRSVKDIEIPGTVRNGAVKNVYKVPIESIKDKLDYSDLRKNLYYVMRDRMKESKSTLATIVHKYANTNGALAGDIRNNKKTQDAFLEGWAKALTDQEAFEVLKDNLAINPPMVLAYMDRALMGKNKKVLFGWLSDNGIGKFERFSKPHHWIIGLFVFSVGMIICFTLNSYLKQMLVLFVTAILSALPEINTHRKLARKAHAAVVEFLENGGKEPEMILLPDNRYEVWKLNEMRESFKKNRW
jgi:hypothetical protein